MFIRLSIISILIIPMLRTFIFLMGQVATATRGCSCLLMPHRGTIAQNCADSYLIIDGHSANARRAREAELKPITLRLVPLAA